MIHSDLSTFQYQHFLWQQRLKDSIAESLPKVNEAGRIEVLHLLLDIRNYLLCPSLPRSNPVEGKPEQLIGWTKAALESIDMENLIAACNVDKDTFRADCLALFTERSASLSYAAKLA